jgi:hypothetical protein
MFTKVKLFLGAVLAAASIVLTPFHLAAGYSNQCCQNVCCEDPCQDDCGGGFKRNAWLLLGAAVLGAAAGAGTAAAISDSHRGHRGAVGPVGPQGIQGIPGVPGAPGTFATATGSILFTFNITLSIAILSGPIQPFVELPNGAVLFGTAFSNAIIDLGVLQTRQITVPAPALVGTYHAGLNVPASLATAQLLVTGTAVPSRGGSSVLDFPIAAIAIGFPGPEFQLTAEFTLGPDGTPLIP